MPAASETVERPPVILSVGHFAEVKGQAILVEAFGRIANNYPQFTLQLAGHTGADGTCERVQKLIQEFQLEKRVVLLGERTDTDLLMRRAAIYVQPSMKEALGLALQEAMFAGCACIGSRTGGIPELIQQGQNGLLFKPGDIGELSRALEELIANPAHREQLGRAAVTSIRDRGMTVESMTTSHLKLYQDARGKG